MRNIRLLALAAAGALALTGALVSAATASAASSVHYVALGDSYSSGVGAGDYTSDSGDCDRSTNAYSQLWADANAPASYVSVACSGATTSDVDADQLSALSSSTTLVSITIGGNDVGFSHIIETCVVGGTDDCVAAVQQAEDTADADLAGWLDTTYDGISADAPDAHVVVLDYPAFYDLTTSGCVGLSSTSRTKIDEGINLVDTIIESTAEAHGFSFGDVRSPWSSGGHQLCGTGSKWLHALNFGDVEESYHPTADGQAGGYEPTFAAAA